MHAYCLSVCLPHMVRSLALLCQWTMLPTAQHQWRTGPRLSELMQIDIAQELPDISESLTLLRSQIGARTSTE